jgi:hypothetical protein
MFTPDAFLTELYVLIDDWDKAQPPEPTHPGPRAQLARSEVLTLALFGQWHTFRSERQFWRYATNHLRPLFPCLPSREQFGQAVHRCQDVLNRLAVHLGQCAVPVPCHFEVLDATGIETRDARRRGRGWMPADAAKGKCTRVGWYVGMRILLCVTPDGAISGFGVGSGNTNERLLADTFFAARARRWPALSSVGAACAPAYLADGGFTGEHWEQRWRTVFAAEVLCPPQTNHRRAWSAAVRRWFAGKRQIVETTTEKLLTTFRMETDRWHSLCGLLAWTAAKIAAFNACVLINKQHHRPPMAFASLINW